MHNAHETLTSSIFSEGVADQPTPFHSSLTNRTDIAAFTQIEADSRVEPALRTDSTRGYGFYWLADGYIYTHIYLRMPTDLACRVLPLKIDNHDRS